MKRPRHTKRRKAAARSASSSSVSEAMWTDSAAAKKMRASARAMGSYTARLRPHLDKLRPYATELRRHAVTAVDAAWTWLHRGIVQVGKVSPRAAKRLEAVETWVCRSELASVAPPD